MFDSDLDSAPTDFEITFSYEEDLTVNFVGQGSRGVVDGGI